MRNKNNKKFEETNFSRKMNHFNNHEQAISNIIMAAYTDVWTSILLIQLVNFDNQAILKLKTKLK